MADENHGSETMDLVWGAREIARAIKRTERQVFYLLQTGALPARRVGGRWCADRQALRRFFQTTEAA